MESLEALSQINNLKKEIDATVRIETPKDLIDEVTKGWTPDDNPLTTTFESFDEILKNKLRGKLGLFVGKGGCKKSLLSQQIAKANSIYGHRSIYSTMEMPATQLVERLIDMSFTDDQDNFHGFNASYFMEKEYQREPKMIKEVLNSGLGATFGDKFIISRKSRMKAEDYEKLILFHNNKYESQASILIVDGLSMMGGTGNEKDDYTINSGELKDLANQYNLFIPLICHVTKNCKRHTRNTLDYIRGSEKIGDNCDFIIQMSLIQDRDTIKDDDCEYVQDLGYARLYDKRGSGKTKNIIYRFNSQKLKMEETTIDPSTVEVKNKNEFM
jgi:hypothetical protein